MKNILDLSRYRVTNMPDGAGAGFKQLLLLNPSTSLPIYTVYRDAASAQAEVTYSRLAKKLRLPNVKAVYGENLQGSESPRYVSVSNYGYRDWAPYATWLSHVNLYPPLRNPKSIVLHEALCHLTQSGYWSNAGAGYVYPDGRFTKANNGGAFFAFGLAQILSGTVPSDIFISEISVGNFMSNYETTSEFQKMLERLAALTDSDLLDCIKTPDILDDQTEGHSYFLSRLRHARYVASKCVDGIIERGIVSKAGNLAMA